MSIDYSDITFVVQGDVADITFKTFASIRKHLPGAPIVMSTSTPNSLLNKLEADDVVISPDPGARPIGDWPGAKMNNINRQIVSSRQGLKKVKTKYAFKIRSDYLIDGVGFLDYFDKFPKCDENFRIFKHKLLAGCYFSRNPRMQDPNPYHPSDVAFFGLAEDLVNLFDIPLDDFTTRYVDERGACHCQYIPEQYLFISYLRKIGRVVPCRCAIDVTPENIVETEKYFASNFIMLDFQRFNLSSIREAFDISLNPPGFHSCFTHTEWIQLYRDHVDASHPEPDDDPDRRVVNGLYQKFRIYRRISNIIVLPIRNKELRDRKRNQLMRYFVRV